MRILLQWHSDRKTRDTGKSPKSEVSGSRVGGGSILPPLIHHPVKRGERMCACDVTMYTPPRPPLRDRQCSYATNAMACVSPVSLAAMSDVQNAPVGGGGWRWERHVWPIHYERAPASEGRSWMWRASAPAALGSKWCAGCERTARGHRQID